MTDSTAAAENANNPYASAKAAYYALGILTIVYSINFIDRQLLSILQESIKADLMLSDAQLGLLTGFAFAVFYTFAGLPIASLADRSNRRNIVAISLTIWSGMTAISGLAQNYWQLLAARVGVGIGEAGGSPPSHSMISDIFPPEKRASAIGFYSTGISIGILFGFLFGGWLNEFFGWRVAFFVVGVPGVLLALVLYPGCSDERVCWLQHGQLGCIIHDQNSPNANRRARYLACAHYWFGRRHRCFRIRCYRR
jgi:MFS family permease